MSLHLDHDAGSPILDTERAARISTPEDDSAQLIPSGAQVFGFLTEGKSASLNWNGDMDQDDEVPEPKSLNPGSDSKSEGLGYVPPKLPAKEPEAKPRSKGGKFTCLSCEAPDCHPLRSCHNAWQVN